MLQSMVPYFILGIGLIIAFRFISEISFFTGIVGRFFGVVAPFFAGGIIAYILNLPCGGIQRLLLKINNGFIKKRSRPLSVLILLIIVIILLVFILNLIIPAIYSSILLFINEFQNYAQTFSTWIDAINDWDLPEFFPDINEDALINVAQDFVQNFNLEGAAASLITGLGGAFMSVFRTIITIIASIYFLLEKDRLRSFIGRMIKAVTSTRTNEIIVKYASKLNFNFHRYIYTQTIDGIILGSIMIVVLLLFGSPFALVLGIILGVVNYIPYFGSIFGTALAVLVVAFTQGIPTAAVAAVVMFTIQQLDGNVIQPKLMGGSFSLSPLLIIISVTIGGFYAGVFGMLVAIPIVAIFKDLLDDYIAYREKKKLETPDESFGEFMDREI